MNLVDYFILFIIAICVMEGVYKGFLHALLGVGAFFLSWLASICFYPLLARGLDAKYDLALTLSTYVEGSDYLGSVENMHTAVASLSDDKLSSIIDAADFPLPFTGLIRQNVQDRAFSNIGLHTLGEYTNHTISIVVINLLCFLLVFFLARFILGFVINAADRAYGFPVLQQFDGLLGGSFGFISGIFIAFVLFTAVPAFLAVQSTAFFKQYFDSAFLGPFFYQSNFILNGIRGIL